MTSDGAEEVAHRAATGVAFPATLRPMEPRDLGYVLGYWLASYGVTVREPRGAWRRRERPRILDMILGGECVVAADPDDDDALFGFACGDSGALHYVFVRQTRRRGGLASAMVRALMASGVVPLTHTYTTRDGARWWAAQRTR